MTPAEELREAARLMRERAQAVGHLTPPWRVSPPERGSDEWLVGYATDNPLAGLVATTPDYGREWIAEHIASWHPGVALAVADWLEATAKEAEHDLYQDTPEGPCCEPPAACQGHDPMWFCERCGSPVSDECVCGWAQALASARAYMGTAPPPAPLGATDA